MQINLVRITIYELHTWQVFVKDKAANGQFLVVEFGLVHSDSDPMSVWGLLFWHAGSFHFLIQGYLLAPNRKSGHS